MSKEQFDYNVVKPDQSEIEIKKGFKEVVGRYVWEDRDHKYMYLGEHPVTESELSEIFNSLKKLNKKTILPGWLSWGSAKK